jgi:hypothetical protein
MKLQKTPTQIIYKMTLIYMKYSKLLVLILPLLPFISSGQTTNVNLATDAGNGGNGNISIGWKAGDVITGDDNINIGSQAGSLTGLAYHNTFVGGYAGQSNTTGTENSYYGFFAGRYTTGTNNTLIGSHSGNMLTSSGNNTFLGAYAGYNTTTGAGNVFLGYSAGYSETTGSNKLYIANSSTNPPLVYGDFSAKQLSINIAPNGTNALSVGGSIYSSLGVSAASVTATGAINGAAITGSSVTSTGTISGASVSSTGSVTGASVSSTGSITGVNVKAGGLLVADNTYPTPAASDLVVQGHIAVGTKFTTNPNGYLLAVNGRIGAKDLQIEGTSSTWSDYAFDDDYKLPTLEEVQLYIAKNHHLQGVPSTKEVEEKGYSTNQMISTLLLKVEELTLYAIEQQKEIEALKKNQKHRKIK